MRRMVQGWMALPVVLASVGLGSGAGAETYPLHEGVTVSPSTVTTPDQQVVVAGKGFPGQQGCSIGRILVLAPGASLVDARILLGPVNLDIPNWSFTRNNGDGSLPAGTYDLLLSCVDESATSQIYSTQVILTVTTSATTTTTAATTPPPTTSPATTTVPTVTSGSTAMGATVEPATAKPGVTTLTIRGGGFKAGAVLQITLGGPPTTVLGSTTATATGEYAATLILPVAAPPGTHPLLVTGTGADGASRTLSANLAVGDLNCSDFSTPGAAQAALGPDGSDPHGLDPDRDGLACKRGRGAQATGAQRSTGSAALPKTGNDRASIGMVAGLAALTLGTLLVGLSHPTAPAAGQHWRRRARP